MAWKEAIREVTVRLVESEGALGLVCEPTADPPTITITTEALQKLGSMVLTHAVGNTLYRFLLRWWIELNPEALPTPPPVVLPYPKGTPSVDGS